MIAEAEHFKLRGFFDRQRRATAPDRPRPETEPVDLAGAIEDFKQSVGRTTALALEKWYEDLDEADAEGLFDRYLEDVIADKLAPGDHHVELIHPDSRVRLWVERTHVSYIDPEWLPTAEGTFVTKPTYEKVTLEENGRPITRFRGIDVQADEAGNHHRQSGPEKVHPEELLILIGLIEGSIIYEHGRQPHR
jgi:hypothetical protein